MRRMRANETAVKAGDGPWGEPEYHLDDAALTTGLASIAPPKDAGALALIVARLAEGERRTPERTHVTPESGVPGDAWPRRQPVKLDAQIAVMCADVAILLANGQPLTLFGDNLLVDLDLSVSNLPTGSRLRLGGALFEVTAEPHDGCRKFRQRFGADALRFISAPARRDLRLRGIYMKVLEAGDIAVGDEMTVVSRGMAEFQPDRSATR
jgi:hypothetical protein